MLRLLEGDRRVQGKQGDAASCRGTQGPRHGDAEGDAEPEGAQGTGQGTAQGANGRARSSVNKRASGVAGPLANAQT
jgi:hypothetical protein